MSILNTSASGMMGNMQWLSTISHNVANSNTFGYKTVETEFSSLVDRVSGRNQNGNGATTSIRSLNSLQGSIISTSTTTDLAVQGAGFFVVSDAGGSLYLTRNGSFVPDSSGNLINSAGFYLMGSSAQGAAGPANSLGNLQRVNVLTAAQSVNPTTSGQLAVNLPSTATIVAPGLLPSNNVVGAAFTEKTSLVTYDNLGGAHTIDIYYTKTGPNTWQVDAFDASKAAAGGGFPYSSGPLTTQAMTFNSANGSLASGSPVSIAIPGGQTLSLDVAGTTQVASAFNILVADVNGNAPSSSTGVSIGSDGKLSYLFGDGSVRPGYNIAIATVASPDNMTSVDGEAFSATEASGPIRTGTAGTGGFGSIASSSLEDSTVDMATELTDMIQAQSAYQANSKVFQAGATVLDVLNNLKS